VQTVTPSSVKIWFSLQAQLGTYKSLIATAQGGAFVSGSTPSSGTWNNVNDGNWTTSVTFTKPGSPGQYAIYRFNNTETKTIYKVGILPMTSGDVNSMVKDFRIQVSTTGTNDGDFTTVLSGSVGSGNTYMYNYYTFTPVQAKYVKIILDSNQIGNYSSYDMCINDFEVYEYATDTSNYKLYYSNASASNPPADLWDILPPGRDANTVALIYFTEGSGATANDYSSSGVNDMSLLNSPSWGDARSQGLPLAMGPYYVSFSSSSSQTGYISSNCPNKHCTIEYWFDGDQSGGQWWPAMQSGGLKMRWYSYSPSCKFDSPFTEIGPQATYLNISSWYHVALVHDSNGDTYDYLYYYVDGILHSSASLSNSGNTGTSSFRIAGDGTTCTSLKAGVIRISDIPRTNFEYALKANQTMFEISSEETYYTSNGIFTSSSIDYDDGLSEDANVVSWDNISWNDTETNGDIKYQVEYWDGDSWELVPDGVLAGNSTGFDDSPINISGLNTTTYNQIRIKANFTYSGGTPILSDWTCRWKVLTAPTSVSASDGTYATKVQVTISPVTGAAGYKVYRSSTLDGTYSYVGSTETTTFNDTSVTATINLGTFTATDGTYYNKVRLSCTASTQASSTYYYKASAYNSTGGEGPMNTTGDPGYAQGSIYSGGWEYYYATTSGGTKNTITTSAVSPYDYTGGPDASMSTPTVTATTNLCDRVEINTSNVNITPGTTWYYYCKAKTTDGLVSGFSNEDSGYEQGTVDSSGYKVQYTTSPTGTSYTEIATATSMPMNDYSIALTVNAPTSVTATDGQPGGIQISLSGASVSYATRYYRVSYKTTDGFYSPWSHTSGGTEGHKYDTINPNGYSYWRCTTADGTYSQIASNKGTSYTDPVYGIISPPTSVSATNNEVSQITITWSGESAANSTTYFYKAKAKSLSCGTESSLSTAYDSGYSTPTITDRSVCWDSVAGGTYSNCQTGVTSGWAQTGLANNFGPRYYKVKVYSADTGWSSLSSSYGTGYTAAAAADVSCNKNTSVWYQGDRNVYTFDFSSTKLNNQEIEYYKYIWDRSNNTQASGSSNQWLKTEGTKSLTPYNSKKNYLHVVPYNKANQARIAGDEPDGTKHYGPFYFVDTGRLLRHGKFFDDDGNLIEEGPKSP